MSTAKISLRQGSGLTEAAAKANRAVAPAKPYLSGQESRPIGPNLPR
jgi:hypothetical protein